MTPLRLRGRWRKSLSSAAEHSFSALPTEVLDLVAGQTYVVETFALAGQTDTVLQLRRMAGAGLKIHPNTDDPAFHLTNPTQCWERMITDFGYGLRDVRDFMCNGLVGAWIDEETRRVWLREWTAEFDDLAQMDDDYPVRGDVQDQVYVLQGGWQIGDLSFRFLNIRQQIQQVHPLIALKQGRAQKPLDPLPSWFPLFENQRRRDHDPFLGQRLRVRRHRSGADPPDLGMVGATCDVTQQAIPEMDRGHQGHVR